MKFEQKDVVKEFVLEDTVEVFAQDVAHTHEAVGVGEAPNTPTSLLFSNR